MRKLQFVLLILCLAISVQGIAGGRIAGGLMPTSHCPMEESESMAQMHSMGMKQQADNAAGHDCCHEAEVVGKTCKMGLGCLASAQYLASSSRSLDVPVEPVTQYPPLVVSVLSFDVSSVWRPPARA